MDVIDGSWWAGGPCWALGLVGGMAGGVRSGQQAQHAACSPSEPLRTCEGMQPDDISPRQPDLGFPYSFFFLSAGTCLSRETMRGGCRARCTRCRTPTARSSWRCRCGLKAHEQRLRDVCAWVHGAFVWVLSAAGMSASPCSAAALLPPPPQPAWVGCKMPRRSQLASAASAEAISAAAAAHERAAREGRAGSAAAAADEGLELDDVAAGGG